MKSEKQWFLRSVSRLRSAVAIASLLLFAIGSEAQVVDEIRNFRSYSDVFASAGQPDQAQLAGLKEAGFERVIYIALSTSSGALAHEDKLVKELGMEYVHIPVAWSSPLPSDFTAFVALMTSDSQKKTLLHCQANFRASAFAFLYRVIYLGESIEAAKADMDSVWKPDLVWRDFIFATLRGASISPDCAVCDWTPGVYE